MAYSLKNKQKRFGRAFNHLEDLTFFYGSNGVTEALSHLQDFNTPDGYQSIRMKWDGGFQVYWGRESENGLLFFAGHNSWSRGVKLASPEDIKDFILYKSGNPQTQNEKTARKKFANEFASLYDLFDKATPSNFIGFVYADVLFSETPKLKNDVFSFSPNPKSKTCYHVNKNSDLGNSISKATVLVAGHAFFPNFGMKDEEQIPITDFEKFNQSNELFVLGPVYNTVPVCVEQSELDSIQSYTKQHANSIDLFLERQNGLADLKNIIYTYVNQTAKAQQLDNLCEEHFFSWITRSRVSQNKQIKIHQLNQTHNNALEKILAIVKQIQRIKDSVIDQLENTESEIRETNGEGRVRYADSTKQFGHIKLVPRKRWIPK